MEKRPDTRAPNRTASGAAIGSRGLRRSRWWMLVLAGALLFVGWDAWQNVRHFTGASSTFGVAVASPLVDPTSSTGYADGRRILVLPARAIDGCHWIMQTQQMLATGEWRVRSVNYDNAPDGRAVHWSSPYRWWLALLAYGDHAVSGRPLGAAVEYAALYSNPLLLGALLLGLVPWIARRFGAAAAAFLAFAMVATQPFYYAFSAANPDHHGLIQASAMVAVIALVGGGAGWTRRRVDETGASPQSDDVVGWLLPTALQARACFAVSAIAGGGGLWVSAAGTIPVLAGVALGALWSAWLGRKAGEGAIYDATLWRWWGAVGGGVSLVAYLVEYFPSNLGLRLEVNHPCYALAWLGGGELLARATRALSTGRWRFEIREWLIIVLAAIAVAVAPAMIFVGGERTFAVADPFLWSLSNDYIAEGQGLATVLTRVGFTLDAVTQCLPMVLIVPVAVWIVRRATPALAKAVLAVALAATVLFWSLALAEIRWWTVGFAFLFGVVVVLAAVVDRTVRDRRRRLWCWLAGALLWGPGFVASVVTTTRNDEITSDDILGLVERDIAHMLRQRAGGDPVVVLGVPTTTSRLVYFGAGRGLGTTYWENLAGMKRAAQIFAARSADDARVQMRAAGVTHLVVVSWDDFVEPYVRLARGLAPAQPVSGGAFGLELLHATEPPPWLGVLPDHLPAHPTLQGRQVRIFEVTDRTRPEEVLVRRANFLMDRGRLPEAATLRGELERLPRDLGALVALAGIHVALRDQAGFAQVLTQITTVLDQASSLELDDRVHLVAVLAIGGRIELARTQLEIVMRNLADRELRRLTPGALMDFVALASELRIAWPDARARELATSLVPPDRRR